VESVEPPEEEVRPLELSEPAESSELVESSVDESVDDEEEVPALSVA
jgi:hypothetical protein